MGRTNEADRDQEDRRSRDEWRPPRHRPTMPPPDPSKVEGKGFTGRITRIINDRGFGFVDGDHGVQYFFHYQVVLPANRTTFDQLTEGQRVRFDGMASAKGPRCTVLEVVEDQAATA